MSNISQRIDVFNELGRFLEQFQTTEQQEHHLNNAFYSGMQDAMARSKAKNGWFTEAQNDPLLPSLVRHLMNRKS
jgi:hypothetical protein